MLVLSRTEGDSISFPELDLSIQVLKVQGGRVQIGVKAAETIRVLRSELLERTPNKLEACNAQAMHDVRNRLNAVSLAMCISQKHLERGDIAGAELALQQIAQKLQNLTSSKPVPLKQSNLLSELLQLNGIDVEVASEESDDVLLMAP